VIRKGALALAILAILLAPTAGLTCDKTNATAAVAKAGCPENCTEPCCDEAAKTAMLASNAHAGCTKSAEALIAVAKKSGCDKTAALAAKAEAGDEEALAALIAKYETASAKSGEGSDGPTTAQLATHAEGGCAKSTQALIAKYKNSGCAKSADLATKAEAGCEKSKAALIAMAKEEGAEKDAQTK
jgi:hypothetical protein